MTGVIRAELRKLVGLPTARVGLLLGLVAAPALALLQVPVVRRQIAAGSLDGYPDLGYQYLGLGLIGAMVLGVTVMSSEYTSTGDDAPGGRQLDATLAAVPHRMRLLAAKAVALVLVTAAQGALTVVATVMITHQAHPGQAPALSWGRAAAAVLYWVLSGLLAYAITLIVRTGVIPLTLLIVNSTVVSVSYLLTKVTPLAAYLPDIAGAQLFLRDTSTAERIPPVTAGAVMGVWVAALLAVAAWLFQRRDA